MAWRVERSADADADLAAIFDFLFESGLAFGEPPAEAVDRAAARLTAIEDAMSGLAEAPFQGTLRPELGEGIRNVTKDRAIFYFVPDAAAECVRVLAIFFGGAEHQRAMLMRLAGQGGDRS